MTRPPSGRHAGGILFVLMLTITVYLVFTPIAVLATTECEEPDGKDTYGLEEPSWDGNLDYCLVSPPPTPTPLPTATPTPVVGKWLYRSWADELSGKKFEAVYLIATSRSGYGDESPVLWLRCVVGTPTREVFIAWRSFVDNDPVQVAYRLAGGDLVQVQWSNSTSGDSTFMPANRRARFVQVLASPATGANPRFIARVWRYDDQTITAGWDMAGVQTAVQRLTERCAA